MSGCQLSAGETRFIQEARRDLDPTPRRPSSRRVYSLRPGPLAEIDEWLGRYRALWEQRLDALHTEIADGDQTILAERVASSRRLFMPAASVTRR
jgi:hypothetical protein